MNPSHHTALQATPVAPAIGIVIIVYEILSGKRA